MQTLEDIVRRLADRDTKRAEANVQADLQSLLLNAPFDLEDDDLDVVVLESPVGGRRRIDVETGTTIFEVKRNLQGGKVLEDAVEQLEAYVRAREAEMVRRYVGVVTDGREWRCYHLAEDGLQEVTALTLRPGKPDVEGLVVWLEGVLATAHDIPPKPEEIARRLGAGSSAHALDQATLRSLYRRYRDNPTVQVKRQLWSKLLTTALGSQFQDSDELFVEHTLLVNSAEVIAHAVLGLDVTLLTPATMLSGEQFTQHGIHGLVESDFFDWVVEFPRGDVFIRSLARRMARFAWQEVEHDVLKVLYESVITTETRKKLGEYYTPDWLAERIVADTVTAPLDQKVLDPACGSGTFLFHAVRRHLQAAEEAELSNADAIAGVSTHVLGMDLHPVAVTLARVTYVLALGRERLTAGDRGPIQIPVYLGDSMQWQQKQLELFTAGFLIIQVEGEGQLFTRELRFPESLLEDARRFDQLVEELAKKASSRDRGAPIPSLRPVFERWAVPDGDRKIVEETFRAMCELHDQDRNHIWGYYVRNLARPVWLSRPDNRVQVLVGNPPWLAYRFMTDAMQVQFREMSEARGLWHGAKVATHQDLSGLFVARVVELYLEKGGSFAFVMPNAALDRAQFAGFRSGELSGEERVRVLFDTPWDLRRIRPHIFPRGSGVVFGQRGEDRVRPLPTRAVSWSGKLRGRSVDWAVAADLLETGERRLHQVDEEVESAYRGRFRQGASVVPRVLFVVEKMPPSPLGLESGTAEVRSRRSAYEKEPWKNLEPLEGVIESEFVYPLYLGEHVLPYRTLEPARAVLPLTRRKLLSADDSRLDLYPRLARWWRKAEELWNEHRSSGRLTLIEQLDYHSKLSHQLPIMEKRIVYAKSGMHLCAAPLRHHRALVDHTLYWATARNDEEAHYLCAILNAAKITELVRPYMSYGKDERHVDKHVWQLQIPEFDPEDPIHAQLATLGARVEQQVRDLDLDEERYFVSLRRDLREHLKASPEGREIEELVVELLS